MRKVDIISEAEGSSVSHSSERAASTSGGIGTCVHCRALFLVELGSSVSLSLFLQFVKESTLTLVQCTAMTVLHSVSKSTVIVVDNMMMVIYITNSRLRL